MKCPKCKTTLREVKVSVAGAQSKAVSYQCPECDYYEFEPQSARRIVEELRDSPLKIEQKIVKLSAGRLGMYFNKNIVDSLNLKKGEVVSVSVPDKKHIVIELK